jgi:phosphatidylethanolamine-binding protein (PEBP) family uncharacterized protein
MVLMFRYKCFSSIELVAPEGTKSFAVTMILDAPTGSGLWHSSFDIPANATTN